LKYIMARLILALISLAAGASGMGTYETVDQVEKVCQITSTDEGASVGCGDGVFIEGTCADGRLCETFDTEAPLRCMCCQGVGDGYFVKGINKIYVPNCDALVPP